MKYLPVILLLIILIIPAITLLSLRKEVGLNQTNEGRMLLFYDNQDFQFSFVSPKNNLNSIVLKLKNFSIKVSVGRNSKPIYLNLLENQKILRQVQINGSNIVEESLVRFSFPEINNSKQKIYSVILNSPESKENEALGIYMDRLNNPVLTTYHIPTSKFQLIANIYASFTTRLLADKIFVLTWLILFGLIAFIIRSIKI